MPSLTLSCPTLSICRASFRVLEVHLGYFQKNDGQILYFLILCAWKAPGDVTRSSSVGSWRSQPTKSGHGALFPKRLCSSDGKPLATEHGQGPAIVGIDRSKCLQLSPVVAAVKQVGAGARIVAGAGARGDYITVYLERTTKRHTSRQI